MAKIDSEIPEGQLAEKWSNYKAHQKLVNPVNKRRLDTIAVGTGFAGASVAASLGEMGFRVFNFYIQDSPRRAHPITIQGDINAVKNYQNDGDLVYRLLYDIIKSGDYRTHEASIYRLIEALNTITDQCVAQGVSFARDYGDTFNNRSFGGAQVSHMFYARGQTKQQLLLGAYSALSRQIQKGTVKLYTCYEMLDLVAIEGRTRGIIAHNFVISEVERFAVHAVVIDTGGYGNVFFLSTNAVGFSGSVAIQYYKKGACSVNPCFAQIHPTCVPTYGDKQSRLTLVSESLRNDGRTWIPKKIEDAKALQVGTKKPTEIPDEDRDFYLERRYPAFGSLVPRDVASCVAKECCDAGFGVNNTGLTVFPDFKYTIDHLGEDAVRARYGNLSGMYKEITGENPYKTLMMILPAIHYIMGDIWVDYELMTSIPGLFATGEANFSDHGANRLGASTLIQGLTGGYLVLPYTIRNYLADRIQVPHFPTGLLEFVAAGEEVKDRTQKIKVVNGKHSVDSIHKELGYIMWDFIGMARTKESLQKALTGIQEARKDFWTNVRIPGEVNELSVELEKALRPIDFTEVGMLMTCDGLNREESCGGHPRTEYQISEGEALRDDKNFSYVVCWKYIDEDSKLELIKEDLNYQFVKVQTRNYKS